MKNVTLCVRGLSNEAEILWQSPENALDWMQEQEEAGLNEEFIITDYEAPFSISEYDNIEEIIEKAEQIENLTDDEAEILEAILENHTNDFEDALKIVVDGDYMTYPDCYDMADVAREYIEETGMLHDVPEFLQNYFDYEAYGRDMSYESTFIYAGDGLYIQIF